MVTYGLNYSQLPPDLVDGEEEQEIEQILAHWYTSWAKKL